VEGWDCFGLSFCFNPIQKLFHSETDCFRPYTAAFSHLFKRREGEGRNQIMTSLELLFSLLALLLILIGLYLHARRSFLAVREGEPMLTWLGVANVSHTLRPDPILIVVGLVILTDALENVGKWPDRFWQSFLLFMMLYVVLLLVSHQVGAILGGRER